MRIDVVGRDIEVTDAIRVHAEEKAGKLTRYFDGIQRITLTISKIDHHVHGEFGVEMITDVVGTDRLVGSSHGHDLYVTLDHAIDKVQRQVKDYKNKLKSH